VELRQGRAIGSHALLCRPLRWGGARTGVVAPCARVACKLLDYGAGAVAELVQGFACAAVDG
jgi:hypothetical protein